MITIHRILSVRDEVLHKLINRFTARMASTGCEFMSSLLGAEFVLYPSSMSPRDAPQLHGARFCMAFVVMSGKNIAKLDVIGIHNYTSEHLRKETSFWIVSGWLCCNCSAGSFCERK